MYSDVHRQYRRPRSSAVAHTRRAIYMYTPRDSPKRADCRLRSSWRGRTPVRKRAFSQSVVALDHVPLYDTSRPRSRPRSRPSVRDVMSQYVLDHVPVCARSRPGHVAAVQVLGHRPVRPRSRRSTG
eukprot:1457732-Rhodomonas_salina.1